MLHQSNLRKMELVLILSSTFFCYPADVNEKSYELSSLVVCLNECACEWERLGVKVCVYERWVRVWVCASKNGREREWRVKLRKEQKVGKQASKAQRREFIFGTMDEGVVSMVGLTVTFCRMTTHPGTFITMEEVFCLQSIKGKHNVRWQHLSQMEDNAYVFKCLSNGQNQPILPPMNWHSSIQLAKKSRGLLNYTSVILFDNGNVRNSTCINLNCIIRTRVLIIVPFNINSSFCLLDCFHKTESQCTSLKQASSMAKSALNNFFLCLQRRRLSTTLVFKPKSRNSFFYFENFLI